jgi:hypothetical protein
MLGSGATVQTGLTTALKSVLRRQNLLRKRAYVLSSLKRSRIGPQVQGPSSIFQVGPTSRW